MSYTIIDVREPYEYTAGHVEEAINIPLGKIKAGAPELAAIPPDANLVVYCRTGSRSNVAMARLHALGYKNIVNGINQKHIDARTS